MRNHGTRIGAIASAMSIVAGMEALNKVSSNGPIGNPLASRHRWPKSFSLTRKSGAIPEASLAKQHYKAEKRIRDQWRCYMLNPCIGAWQVPNIPKPRFK